MIGAVDHLDIGERRRVPAKDVLVVALGRRRAGEVVAVRGEAGDRELRGHSAGFGQHVGEPDTTDRLRRAVRSEPLDEGGRVRSGNFELGERREVHETGPGRAPPCIRPRLSPSRRDEET